MSYSSVDDLYNLFGRINIRKWADLDNHGDDDTIDARVAWALEQANDELNSRLARSPYQFPLTGTIPPIVKRVEGYLAAMLLNEGRSITDTDEDVGDLKSIAKRVMAFVNGVKLGTIQITGITPVVAATEIPFAVNDFPQVRFPATEETWYDSFYREWEGWDL